MITNDAGRMIARWWDELGSKYARVQPDLHVVMPNHFHGIVIIEGDPIPVGAALRGRPYGPLFTYTTPNTATSPEGAHADAPLPDIVGWFKTMTTNEYIRGVKTRGWPRFDGHLRQRDYYERVIRSEDELLKVREYVNNNPAKWEDDPNHPSNVRPYGTVLGRGGPAWPPSTRLIRNQQRFAAKTDAAGAHTGAPLPDKDA